MLILRIQLLPGIILSSLLDFYTASTILGLCFYACKEVDMISLAQHFCSCCNPFVSPFMRFRVSWKLLSLILLWLSLFFRFCGFLLHGLSVTVLTSYHTTYVLRTLSVQSSLFASYIWVLYAFFFSAFVFFYLVYPRLTLHILWITLVLFLSSLKHPQHSHYPTTFCVVYKYHRVWLLPDGRTILFPTVLLSCYSSYHDCGLSTSTPN